MRECVRISDAGLAAVAENGALEELDCSLVPAAATATAVALTAYCKCDPSLPRLFRISIALAVPACSHVIKGNASICCRPSLT